jgi:hypothetical protein
MPFSFFHSPPADPHSWHWRFCPALTLKLIVVLLFCYLYSTIYYIILGLSPCTLLHSAVSTTPRSVVIFVQTEYVTTALGIYCTVLYLPPAFTLVSLLNLFFRPWRWRRYVPPKRRLTLNGLHGVISQEIVLFEWISLSTRKMKLAKTQRSTDNSKNWRSPNGNWMQSHNDWGVCLQNVIIIGPTSNGVCSEKIYCTQVTSFRQFCIFIYWF